MRCKTPCNATGHSREEVNTFLFFSTLLFLRDTLSYILFATKHPVMLQDTVGVKLKDNLYWQNRFFAFMLRRRSKKFKRVLNILPSIIFNCAVKKLSLCPEEKKGYELTISKPC